MRTVATSVTLGGLVLACAWLLIGCAAPVANVPGAVPTDPASPLSVTVAAEPSSLKVGDQVSITVTVKNISAADLFVEGWHPDRSVIPDYKTFPFWVTVFDPQGHATTTDNWVNTGAWLWVVFEPLAVDDSLVTTKNLTLVYLFDEPGRYGLQVRYVSDARRGFPLEAWGGEAYSAPIWIDVSEP